MLRQFVSPQNKRKCRNILITKPKQGWYLKFGVPNLQEWSGIGLHWQK